VVWRKLGATFLILAGAHLSILAEDPAANDGWKSPKNSGGLVLYSRPHEGSRLKELKAVGQIDAPTRAVYSVIEDVDAYPSFMPYTSEARLVKRERDSVIEYQRLSPKICSDRDYTLRIRKKSWPMENGLAYFHRWEPANEHGPAEKPGVFRVQVCEGSWLLEPAGPGQTRATYSIYTDSGLAVPAFVANGLGEMAIKKVFAAVRKQVKDPKYRVE
jgi:hypothetical protein